ncbi:hypothetical protein Btru_013972 [Bulinus truncatus]|nr:hypothetical protein Btru_013972 [Bulinus truncatus]
MTSSSYPEPINFCPEGFFGSECRFRCHCHNVGVKKGCRMSGLCFQGEICARPYFGYLCQYLNVAQEDVKEETFANDLNTRTCSQANLTSNITFTFKKDILFHFISVEFRENNDLGVNRVDKIDLTFPLSPNGDFCGFMLYWNMSRTRVDIYCQNQLYVPVSVFTLSGPAVSHICEVYISGGKYRLSDFTLGVEDIESINFTKPLDVFDVPLSSVDKVSQIHVTVNKKRGKNLFSQMCSFDIYGECVNCATGTDCVGGHCTGGCQSGYKGPTCSEVCGKCNGTGDCDQMTGVCINGCLDGYAGPLCDQRCTNCAGLGACEKKTGYCFEGCNLGFKGKACSEHCTNCGGSGACDPITGSCKHGCQHGFKGNACILRRLVARRLATVHWGASKVISKETVKEVNTGQSSSFVLRLHELPEYMSRNLTALEFSYCKATFDQILSSTSSACSNCDGDGSCHSTGKCKQGCKSGFYGEMCHEVCQNCAGDRSCSMKEGYCSAGCKQGYRGPNCKEPDVFKNDDTTLSVFVFYLIFIMGIFISLGIVLFAQKIFMVLYVPSRASIDSLRHREGGVSPTDQTSSESTRTEASQNFLRRNRKEKEKFTLLTDFIIEAQKKKRLSQATTSVDITRSSISSGHSETKSYMSDQSKDIVSVHSVNK